MREAHGPGSRTAKVHCGDDFIFRSAGSRRAGAEGSLGVDAARVALRRMSPWLPFPAYVALLAYVLAALPVARFERVAGPALIIGWLAHGLAISLDWSGVGRTVPGVHFGFAPALSTTLWIVLAVYGVESRLVPITRVRRTLAVLGAVVVAIAIAFPGETFAQHAPWAPVHWLLGIVSYGLFGAAVLHAGLLSAADRQMRKNVAAADLGDGGLPLMRLERLTFQFVRAGFVVLTATLILGWWFTAVWRWDQKIVFSILAWLVFAALLTGRSAFGWRGRRATLWVYAGAGLLLFAYVGSRFIFEVMLHRPFA